MKRFDFSIFIKYLLYFIVLCLLTLTLGISIYLISLKSEKNNFVEKYRYLLDSNVMDINDSLITIKSFQLNIIKNTDFRKLMLINNDQYTLSSYYQIKQLQKRLLEFSRAPSSDIISNLVVTLTKSGRVITPNRVYHSIEECFKDNIIYAKYAPKEIFDILTTETDLQGNSDIKILPETYIEFPNGTAYSGQYLTFIFRSNSFASVIFALYNKDELLSIFDLNSLPDETFFYISSSDKTIILNHNFDFGQDLQNIINDTTVEYKYREDDFLVLSKYLPSIKSNFVLGIPNSYFNNQISDVKNTIILFISIAFILGILIALYFAFVNYRPVKKIINLPAFASYSNKISHNAFEYIQNVIENLNISNKEFANNIKKFKNQLKDNIIIKILGGFDENEEDRSILSEYLPFINNEYIVIIIDISSYDSNTGKLLKTIYDKLSVQEIPGSHIQKINTTQILSLVKKESEEKFENHLNILINNSHPNVKDIIHLGVSSYFSGPENINRAYYQAQSCLSSSKKDTIVLYENRIDSEKINVLDFEKIHILYKYIINNDTKEIDEFFTEILDSLIRGETTKGRVIQTYYLIRFTIILAIKYLDQDEKDFKIQNFNETDPLKKSFDKLKSLCIDLCEFNKKTKVDDNIENTIVKYINKNFKDPNFYAGTITSKYNISTKQLSRIIRKSTGFSTRAYIEQLRLKKALNYLSNSDMPINEIALKCGFYSRNTFYKVFRKEFGMSPSDYRLNQICNNF